MIVRLIEISKEATLNTIPASNAVIFYCTDTMKAYFDSNGIRNQIDFLIKVNALPSDNIQQNKVYFLSTDSKLYRYDRSWYTITSLEEMFDIIADNEDAVGGYLVLNGKNIIPITSSELVMRPSGENIEDSLVDAEREIVNGLNPYYRTVTATSDNQKVFIIPLPYSNFLNDGNTFEIYVNKVKKTVTTDYTIDYVNYTVTLATAVNKASVIEYIFYYNADQMSISQEVIISRDKVRTYTLSNSFIPGANRVSLYINGVKQPKQAFTEVNKNTITLNGDIPKESIIMVEIGTLKNNSASFYDYFNEDCTVKTTASNITVTYPQDVFGKTRKIIKDLDSSKRVIKETAYINNIAVAVRNVSYNDATGTVTYTHTNL